MSELQPEVDLDDADDHNTPNHNRLSHLKKKRLKWTDEKCIILPLLAVINDSHTENHTVQMNCHLRNKLFPA